MDGVVARRQLGNIASPLFYRLIDGNIRRARRAAFSSLMQTQYWSVERLRDVQERLLRRLLVHACTVSPWYRERMRDGPEPARFGLDDLRHLPVLERSDLQDHLDEIAGPNRGAAGVTEAHSSGSSGAPVRLYHSREFRDWWAAESDRNLLMCAPFRLGMPRAFFWGSDTDAGRHRGPGGTGRDLLVNLLWFTTPTRAQFPETIRKVRSFQPALVVGYVSSLVEVARALDGPLDGLRAIATTAEMLTSAQRSVIAQGFGAPVFDRYASREVGTVAHECEAHEGLHVSMETNIVEVVDAGGRPLTRPGDEGEILITSLRNLATPLIRYRLGDMARLADGVCACGRGSLRLASVLGRTTDAIVTPSGRQLPGEFFVLLFQDAPLRRYRVDQETTRRLRIQVVPSPDYSDDVRRRVTSFLLTRGDPDFEILWEVVNEIPLTAAGKLRYVVSHVNREY